MLKSSYLTAEQLGIEPALFDALVTVKAKMESGEITEETFDMSEWCGTSCCIFGHCLVVGGSSLEDKLIRTVSGEPCINVESLRGAFRLFMPMCGGGAIGVTDPLLGARAIGNYLTTGNADWAAVMAEAQQLA